jgi:uroporphyrinogen III methyltransferase/synthase
VTRSGGPDCRLTRLLREAGADPLQAPLTQTLPPSRRDALDRELAALFESDWLVVTSARSLPPLVAALGRRGIGAKEIRAHGVEVCAVGPETAKALRSAGFEPTLVPDRFHAEGVVEALTRSGVGPGTRIFFPRAEEGRDVIPTMLSARGAEVRVVAVYRTEPLAEEADRLVRLLAEGRCDAVTFTAASAAAAFAEALDRSAGRRAHGPGSSGRPGVIALGPSTAAALTSRGIPVDRIAAPHTLEALVEAVADWARTARARRPGGPEGVDKGGWA